MTDLPPRKNTPEEIARNNGSYIVKELSSGAFGDAYLLGNNRVLKVTRMKEEFDCADRILDERLWEVTPHLPVVRVTGETWMEFADQLVRHYWYIREGLDDLTKLDVEAVQQESGQSIDSVLENIINNLRDQGLDIRDARRLENWGKRSFRYRFEIVLRDLWCVKLI